MFHSNILWGDDPLPEKLQEARMSRSKGYMYILMLVLFVIAVSTHFRFILRVVFERSESSNILSTDCHEYSPAYPSLGGSGCSPKCLSSGGRQNISYGAAYYNNTHRWPSDLLNNMHHAGEILKKYGPVNSLDTAIFMSHWTTSVVIAHRKP